MLPPSHEVNIKHNGYTCYKCTLPHTFAIILPTIANKAASFCNEKIAPPLKEYDVKSEMNKKKNQFSIALDVIFVGRLSCFLSVFSYLFTIQPPHSSSAYSPPLISPTHFQ